MLNNFIFFLLFLLNLPLFGLNQGEKITLTLLHTNDHHGRFWKNEAGEYGLAAQKTLVDQLRKQASEEKSPVLLLSGGDINTGVPTSDLKLAEPDFLGMKKLGYDAMAVGNHEFDHSLETILWQQSIAGFDFLAANIYQILPNKKLIRPFKPYIIRNLESEGRTLKVAIVGLTTEDTPHKTKVENIAGLVFIPILEEGPKIISEIYQKENPELLIVVSHIGHYQNGKHGPDAPGDVELARTVCESLKTFAHEQKCNKHIDIIVGGHTQKPLFKPDFQGNAYILQAHEWGKYLGYLKFEVSKDKKNELQKKLISYELKPINFDPDHKQFVKNIVEDPSMLELLAPYQLEGDKLIKLKVAETEVDLIGDRDTIRLKKTNLSNLILDSMLNELSGVDFALVNAGGIRSGIPKGEISYYNILQVQPFGSEVVIVHFRGNEIESYLRKILKISLPGHGGFMHLKGLDYQGCTSKDIHCFISIRGRPLNPRKLYKMATIDFITKGGDKYPVIEDYSRTGYTDATILNSYLSKIKVYREVKGIFSKLRMNF